jgi:RNase P subunit RPR2
VGDPGDCPKDAKQDRKLILNMLRGMWLNGDSPLRRIYSSWEELESNLEIKSETTSGEKHTYHPCPNCGAKQRIVKPFEGIFPIQTCKSCKQPFHINNDLTVRKLSKEEKRELPEAWIQVVEDMNKKKVAVVFGLE